MSMDITRAVTVDAHQHFWQIGRFPYSWEASMPPLMLQNYLPPHLRPFLDAAGVRRTVVVQALQGTEEISWLSALAEEYDWIAGIVGWVNLADPAVGHTLDTVMKYPKLKGVRHFVEEEPDSNWLLRADVLRGLGEVAQRGLTFDLLVKPWQLHCVSRVAERWPTLKLVVDHIAKPIIAERGWEPWASQIAEIAQIPHLYCKLSGMITEADRTAWRPEDLIPYVQHIVTCFGYQRLMFGSDWPVCLLAGTYDQVIEALFHALGPLEPGTRARIMGGAAAEFYGLDEGVS